MSRPHVARQPHGAGHVDAGRAAHAQPFVLEQIEDDRHGFLVGNEVGLVDLDVLDDRRHASEPDAFRDRAALRRLGLAAGEQVVHCGSFRVGDADDDAGLLLAQIHGDAGDGAAGADGADEAVDAPLRLLPDLGPGGDIVSLAIVEIVPLVGVQHAVGLALAQVVGDAPRDVLVVVRIAVGHRRDFDQLGAAQAQHVLLFLALRFRDDDEGAVAAGIRHQRQADPGIAGRALDHQAAGPDLAALFGFQNDLARRPVLHGLARIHELRFAENGAAGRLGHTVELDEWRVADGFDDAVVNLHVFGPGL